MMPLLVIFPYLLVMIFASIDVAETIPNSGVTLLWKYDSPFGITSSPVTSATSGLVYYVTKEGFLTTVDLVTGKIVWVKNLKQGLLDFSTTSTPLLSKNVVFVGGVKAMNIITGKPLWRRDIPYTQGKDVGGLFVNEDSIFTGSRDGVLYAQQARNGNLKWKTRLLGEKLSKPVLYENLPGNSQSLIMSCSIPSKSRQSSDSSVPLARDGYIHAVDAKNGHLVWRFSPAKTSAFFAAPSAQGIPIPIIASAGASSKTPILIEGVTIVLAASTTFDERHYVHALNAQTGDELWRYEDHGRVLSAPVFCPYDTNGEGSVYFTSLDGTISSLSAKFGERRWTTRLGAAISGSPSMVCSIDHRTGASHDVSLFVGTNSGSLACVVRSTGRIRWTFNMATNAVISTPLVIDEEAGSNQSISARDSKLSIVFGSLDGNLYKIRGPPLVSSEGGSSTNTSTNKIGSGSLLPGKSKKKGERESMSPTMAPVASVRSGTGEDGLPLRWTLALLLLLLSSMVVFIYYEYREFFKAQVERYKWATFKKRLRGSVPEPVNVACIQFARIVSVTIDGVSKAARGHCRWFRLFLWTQFGISKASRRTRGRSRRKREVKLDLAPLGVHRIQPYLGLAHEEEGMEDGDAEECEANDSDDEEREEFDGEYEDADRKTQSTQRPQYFFDI